MANHQDKVELALESLLIQENFPCHCSLSQPVIQDYSPYALSVFADSDMAALPVPECARTFQKPLAFLKLDVYKCHQDKG